MHGWCEPEKAVSLARAVMRAPTKVSVELGVFGGRSLIAMAMAHQHLNQGGMAWGFDPWTKEAALEGDIGNDNADWWAKVNLDEVYNTFVRHVVHHNVINHCYWFRIRAEKVVGFFEDESIGVLHIDANHSEVTSCRDSKLWSPKVAKGGFLFFDDIDWPSTAKAQKIILNSGFKEIDNRTKYAIYQKV